MELDVDLVLAGVDTSEDAAEAASVAVELAGGYEADLHLLHVVDERVVRGIETGDLEAEALAKEHRAFDDRVHDLLAECEGAGRFSSSSVSGFSTHRLSQTPGSVVLDAAEELEVDFLVIPRVFPSGDSEEALGKAFLYVLEYASQPVLSV